MDQKTEAEYLKPGQLARAQALTVARDVLAASAPFTGRAAVKPGALLTVAEYILHGPEELERVE